MSYYELMRFRGVVKKEFRASFEPIAVHGLWEGSTDPVFAEFGMNDNPEAIPTWGAGMLERWEKNPWQNSYNVETGEWIFQCGYNVRTAGTEFEEKIVPHCMEHVEHCETWTESSGDDTLLKRYVDGKWVWLGYITAAGGLIPLRRVGLGHYQSGEETEYTIQTLDEIARKNSGAEG